MTPEAPRQDGIRTLLVRGGLAVWLVLGLVLIAIALRTPPPAALPGAQTALRATPAAPVKRDSLARRYTPEYGLRTGPETMLVLVGGSFCLAHRRPGFHEAVEDAKLRVRDQARAQGRQFRAVAVSLDWKTEDALAFLEGFGAFDEIAVGSNWVSDGAMRYVWRDLPGEPVVPQLLVIERHVDAESAVRVSEERVVKRVMGVDEIFAWVRSGATL